LIPWIQASIAKGSTVYTDGLSSYRCIPSAGYKHVAVIPEKHNPGSYLYMVHLIISNVKAWLLGTFHGSVSKKHLPAYLNEYVFRFNRRFWPGAAFHRSLGLAMNAEDWPEYETLYDVGREEGWVHPHLETDPYTLEC
jgi:transposase-like protein